MKVKVIEIGGASFREFRCPHCGHLNSLIIEVGELKGKKQCWACYSTLAWSIEDELKEWERRGERG